MFETRQKGPLCNTVMCWMPLKCSFLNYSLLCIWISCHWKQILLKKNNTREEQNSNSPWVTFCWSSKMVVPVQKGAFCIQIPPWGAVWMDKGLSPGKMTHTQNQWLFISTGSGGCLRNSPEWGLRGHTALSPNFIYSDGHLKASHTFLYRGRKRTTGTPPPTQGPGAGTWERSTDLGWKWFVTILPISRN